MQLTYSEQSSSGRRQRILPVLCALLLGTSAFAAGISAFGLAWSPAKALQGGPLHGLLSVCNSIADRLGATDYIILRRFADGAASDGSALPQGTFLTIMLAVLCVLAYLIIRSGCRPLLLIFAVPAALLMLTTGTAPGVWSGLVLGFALACSFACMQSLEGGSVMILVPVACALAVTLLAGIAIDQTTGFSQSGLQKKTQTVIEDRLEKRYGQSPLAKGNLAGLEADQLKALRGSSETVFAQLVSGGKDKTKTALQVTQDPADGTVQPLWLRGFVGETYRNHRWMDLGNGTYYAERDTLYWLNKKGFDGLSQWSEGAQLSAPEQAGSPLAVTIKTEKADRSNIYTPYEMTGTDQMLPGGTQNYAGGFLRTDKAFGTKKTEYQVLPDMAGTWTDWVGRLYSAENNKELQAYYTNESHYNVWCYEHYTDVPDELATSFYMVLGDPGDLTKNHADYHEAINSVQEYLDKNFIYSENFKAPEDGEDPIENFMLSGKGCDAHYASLATMMMRFYGIPARYVEGYVFTPADAREAKAGQPYLLGFSHAHAWTEVYIDGFGWVPMEFTGAWKEVMPQADLSRGLQSVAYEKKKDDLTDTPMEEAAEDKEPPDYGALVLRILLVGALIAAGLLSIFFLQKLVRRLIARRRLLRAFADPDARKGICAMYGHMLAEGIPLTEQAKELGDRAAYSRLSVYEYERNAMRQELEWGEHEKKKNDKMARGSLSDRIGAYLGRLRRK